MTAVPLETSAPRQTLSAQAKVWRERAARYRALARVSFNSEARQNLLKLAEDCERYASKADAQPKLD